MKGSVRKYVKRLATRVAQQKGCTVVVIMGGSKIEAIKYHGHVAKTITYVLDNPEDLAKWSEACRDLGVKQISVGRGHTSITLSEMLGGFFRDVISRVAPMNANSGCGASPLLGYLAALARVVMSDFKLIMEKLYSSIYSLSGGIANEQRARMLISAAGGCGSGLVRVVSTEFEKVLRRLGTNVRIDIDVLCAGAYAEVSSRTRLTAAAVIPFLLAFVLDRSDPRSKKVVKTVTFCELPPGLTAERRSSLLLNQEVALCCGDFHVQFDFLRPNNSTTSLYGNVILRETDYFWGLDPEKDIAARIARIYLTEIQEKYSLVASDSTAIDEIEYIDKTISRHAKTIGQISATLGSFSCDATMAAIKTPEFKYDYDVFVTVTRGERYDCSNLRHLFSSVPLDLTESIAQCTLIQSLVERLNSERESFEASTSITTEECQSLETELKTLYSGFTNPRSWWDYARSWWQYAMTLGGDLQQSQIAAFEKAAGELRQKSNDLANNEAALKKILIALEDLRRELKGLESRIEAVSAMLQSFLPSGTEKSTDSMITVYPIDAHFPALVEATTRSKDMQLNCLQLCAGTVTIEGLAKVTGATAPLVDSIVDAIVNGEPQFIGPPLGAVECQDAPLQMYVLPPVEQPMAASLLKQFKDRHSIENVAFYETLVGGANVLRFRFRFPREAREVITGCLLEELQAAIESPNAALFFPGNPEYAKIGGIRINKDSFEFIEPELIWDA